METADTLSDAAVGRVEAAAREWMRGHVRSGRLPGMLLMVARDGRVVLLQCEGARDVESALPVTPDTIFRIYSMTKPVTSVAAMMLCEQGRFGLDDPVADYLPCFTDMQVLRRGGGMATEPAARPITIRDLLTHTAGLSYGFGNSGLLPDLYRQRRVDFDPDDGPLSEVVARLAELPLAFQPGSRWHYGVSTDVLGYLVEVVSGVSFDEFVCRRICEPLGMRDTGFRVAPADVDRFAALYGPAQGGGLSLLQSPGESPEAGEVSTFSGGSGLVSTCGDYFRFLEMLRRGGELDGVRLLSEYTVESMTRNQLPGDLADMGQRTFVETLFEGVGFGLGFAVLLDPARAGVPSAPGEYAWGGAASTAFWIDPKHRLTVILLTQLLPSDTYPLRREARELVYHALFDIPGR